MAAEIRNGKEILDDFFDSVSGISGVDGGVADAIVVLYKEGKLSSTHLGNALLKLREEAVDGKD